MFFNNFELFWKILMLLPVTPHLVHSFFPPSLQCCQSGSMVLSGPCKEVTRAISLCVPELPHLSLLFLSRCKLTPKYGLLRCFPQSRDHVPGSGSESGHGAGQAQQVASPSPPSCVTSCKSYNFCEPVSSGKKCQQ